MPPLCAPCDAPPEGAAAPRFSPNARFSPRHGQSAPQSRQRGMISLRTLIKLVIACLIVGAMLSFIGADPLDFWRGLWSALRDAVQRVFDEGLSGALRILNLIALGAVIVLPLWGLREVLRRRRPPAAPGPHDRSPDQPRDPSPR